MSSTLTVSAGTHSSSSSSCQESPVSCYLLPELKASDWVDYAGFHVNQLDAILMGSLDPISAEVEDSSNAELLLYDTPDTSQCSLAPPQIYPMSALEQLPPPPLDVFGSITSHALRDSNRSSCDCLQHLAALFVQLKEYTRQGGQVLDASVAIAHVRQGVLAWRRHLQCTTCIDSADGDSLLLSVIEIRMILPIIESINSKLELGRNLAFILRVAPLGDLCHAPMTYELADDESRAVLRTLLLLNMGFIIDIIQTIKERPSQTKLAGHSPAPAFGLCTPQASPSSLLSTGSSDLLSILDTPEGPESLFGQSLQSLMESAKSLQTKIAGDGIS
ncbi:hypothetical protein DCS_02239 [Drechmeria coniospora]|uniref:Uncharacterized protein n=1 Tax=Drechmeria coniospora TaxID=98403 RepID=A0A151GVH8_DRECN|nr:hypothetical protein DCS_02239 [Drechmeria coniospora]KYK61098.1 hypothetical protein DCS_02239 [Drechmeria coniospora]